MSPRATKLGMKTSTKAATSKAGATKTSTTKTSNTRAGNSKAGATKVSDTAGRAKDVFEVGWALFGELSRALALKVARDWDPEIVVGIATAGVIPGATVAAILDVEFHSMLISRRYHAEIVRETPAVFGAVPAVVKNARVLLVDETCDSGATMRLALAAIVNAGAREVRTAVSFKTGAYAPNYHGLATDSAIVLPWDREILVDGELVLNPLYEGLLDQ